MGLFKDKKKVGLIADVIRCDESEYLVWKWHPDGKVSGEHKREYAIRCGSVLRVRDGEVAVFVYKNRDRVFNDYIAGPFEQTLKTKNLPMIGRIIDAFWGGDTPFQAEVYFINTAKLIQSKFGVPYFDVPDYRYPDFSVPVAVRGTVDYKIEDCEKFVKTYRLQDFKIADFSAKIRDSIIRYTKNVVANLSYVHEIPVVQLERRITAVNEILILNLQERLELDYGVKLVNIDVTAIELDKSSQGYKELMAVTKDITTASVQIRAAADNENYAETLRINREEDAYSRRMRTRSENIGAYTVEEGAKVGVASAEALGEMGAAGGGSVDIGGGSFNPAAMMTGMAVASVVGEGLAGTMRTAMSGATASAGAATPPPVPTIAYYVAKDSVPIGPFEITVLTTMIATGELKAETLVWKTGMPAWVRADSVEEIAALFPPPLI